jgi:PAS domain S-box-containing protein
MSDEQIRQHFQVIRQRLAALRGEDTAAWEEIDASLEDLQVIHEQMQSNLEAIQIVEEEFLQQKQYYQDLFQFFPIASLVTDANGLILEANQAIAQLLNVSRHYLVTKPLAVFVAEGDRMTFRTHLNQLSQSVGIQIWQMSLHPRNGEPILVELHVAIARNTSGQIEYLRIGMYNLSHLQETIATINARTSGISPLPAEIIAPLQPQHLDDVLTGLPMPQLPHSLDGLRVLVVDDEPDIREFITAVLESHGIGVRSVASAAAALEELERFRPDVLLSDIRLPDEDGYSLIRRIRALEADQGGHLPAAAITAYLDEDREKALKAGFEAYLYKLVQPIQWVEMVAQLARPDASSEQDS